jgi:hypothetical protein
MTIRNTLEVVKDAALSFLILWAVLMALNVLWGCTTTKTRVEVQEVKVPVYVPPPPIVIPTEPEWEVYQNETDWIEQLRIITRDLIRAWAYIEELQWTIEVHNEAITPHE